MPHWFLERLREFAPQPALFWQGRTYLYQDLLNLVQNWRESLAAREIREGECVAMFADPSPQACALLLALLVNRNVIVPLGTNAAGKNSADLDIACVGGVFEFHSDDTWDFQRRPAAGDHPLLAALRDQREPGLVLFTSGSTGDHKATLISGSRLLERFQRRRQGYRTLIFLKLDHIGGLNSLFHILAEGGLLVSPEDRRPRTVCQAIERQRIQLLPTTPTFLNMLLISEAYREFDLSSLELITYGTEPMPESTLASLTRAFPNVRFKQTYGLSELGILPTKSRSAGSVWLQVGGEGYETKIVDGVLWIRTRSAMLGYLNAPSPFDEQGWFNTQDAVEVDGDYLRILGRTSEIINVGGEKVYPAEVESVLLRMENIADVTVYGRPNPVMGQIVLARVNLHQPEDPEHLDERMRAFCHGQLDEFKIPMRLEISHELQYSERFKKNRGPSRT